MEINDKVARCRLLASIIVADDFVEDVELDFLERTMTRLGLDEEEKTRVMVIVDADETLDALDSLTEEEREEFLDSLAEVAWVDGDLDDYEVAQIHKVASAMGLGETAVRQALRRAENAST